MSGVRGKALIGISGRKLSRHEGAGSHLIARETLTIIFFTLGVIGGPFLLTMIPLLFLYTLGLFGTNVAGIVFWSSAYISYAVLLPLAVGLSVRSRERKQKIAGEMMAFFSAKIVALYSVSKVTPAIAEDPRAAEAFILYSQANRIVETAKNPLHAREIVERGVSLADELMADHRTSNCG